LAEATRGTWRDAQRDLDRAATAQAVPAFGAALADGDVSGAHVDVVGRGLRSLEPELRPALADAAAALVPLACGGSAQELDKAIRAEIRRLRRDGGMERLEQQRRSVRARTWVDRGDGMWHVHAVFDPETATALATRLGNALDTLFAHRTPELAPVDPVERQDFLRAHALAALLRGEVAASGRPEIIAVVDTTTPEPDGAPSVDWGLPVELPHHVLVDLFARADVHPVIVRNGVVLYAPGTLNLGRATRLANRAQRRALRALYSTCAIPGCPARFDSCDIHHVIWWEEPWCGPTDLDNLLPLCSRHHHSVHDHGWQLHLDPHRTLTITYPDHTTTTARPNRSRAPDPTLRR
jgi:hypothetical protein